MNNKSLIESLEYHVSILEEEQNRKSGGLGKVAAVGAGVAGGALAGRKIGGAAGVYGSALKHVKTYNTARNNIIKAQKASPKPGTVAKSVKGIEGIGANGIKMNTIKAKVARAGKIGKVIGAVGGAVAGGVAAKKAYDHFKNKNK